MNIIHGDCLEELKKLEDNSIDAVVCDPPYGLSNTKPAQVALNKGFTPIGIEQDADYIKLIEKRLEATCTTHKN